MHPTTTAPRLLWRTLSRATASSTSAVASARSFSSKAPVAPLSATRPSTHAGPRSPSLSLLKRAVQRRAYSSEPPKKDTSGIKFLPFVAVIALTSGAFVILSKRRNAEANMPALPSPEKPAGSIAAPAKPTPTFSPANTTVIFVLGGPGAGKGTQCANLVEHHGFTHLSAGDLLRAEQDRPGSQFGQLIRDYIKDGLIVPMEVTVQLLENAMTDSIKSKPAANHKFLIDGFPRKLDQAHKFEQAVCPARLVLFYDCPEEEMERRLLERGKTSGRADDNAESIRKRFRTFIETSMPVVDEFEKQGKVVKVDATTTPDKVYKKTKEELSKHLGEGF